MMIEAYEYNRTWEREVNRLKFIHPALDASVPKGGTDIIDGLKNTFSFSLNAHRTRF